MKRIASIDGLLRPQVLAKWSRVPAPCVIQDGLLVLRKENSRAKFEERAEGDFLPASMPQKVTRNAQAAATPMHMGESFILLQSPPKKPGFLERSSIFFYFFIIIFFSDILLNR